tara:strand:+ start:35441 stop:36424 length:984 start_codon:yes stop_codon:yes gene_type:complete
MSLTIDTKYISLVSSRLEKFARKKDYLYNCRCPYCGDSQKNKNKARGYFYRSKTGMNYKCHNCGHGTTVEKFVKFIDPELHKQYIMERWSEKGKRSSSDSLSVEFKPVKFRKINSNYVTRITDLEKTHHARSYLENRKLPIGELYFTEDFKMFVEDVFPDNQTEVYHEPRIVIPFYDQSKNLICVQGRSIHDFQKMRYITVKSQEDVPKIFGLDRVRNDETIYILEGPLDSLLLDNSIAVGGSDGNIPYDDVCWVLDNEPRNKELVKKIEKLIEEGEKVCIWPDKIYEKDINEMILNGYSSAEILDIINNNTHRGMTAKIALTNWRK